MQFVEVAQQKLDNYWEEVRISAEDWEPTQFSKNQTNMKFFSPNRPNFDYLEVGAQRNWLVRQRTCFK